jgi:hypothetical protein
MHAVHHMHWSGNETCSKGVRTNKASLSTLDLFGRLWLRLWLADWDWERRRAAADQVARRPRPRPRPRPRCQSVQVWVLPRRPDAAPVPRRHLRPTSSSALLPRRCWSQSRPLSDEAFPSSSFGRIVVHVLRFRASSSSSISSSSVRVRFRVLVQFYSNRSIVSIVSIARSLRLFNTMIYR